MVIIIMMIIIHDGDNDDVYNSNNKMFNVKLRVYLCKSYGEYGMRTAEEIIRWPWTNWPKRESKCFLIYHVSFCFLSLIFMVPSRKTPIPHCKITICYKQIVPWRELLPHIQIATFCITDLKLK